MWTPRASDRRERHGPRCFQERGTGGCLLPRHVVWQPCLQAHPVHDVWDGVQDVDDGPSRRFVLSDLRDDDGSGRPGEQGRRGRMSRLPGDGTARQVGTMRTRDVLRVPSQTAGTPRRQSRMAWTSSRRAQCVGHLTTKPSIPKTPSSTSGRRPELSGSCEKTVTCRREALRSRDVILVIGSPETTPSPHTPRARFQRRPRRCPPRPPSSRLDRSRRISSVEMSCKTRPDPLPASPPGTTSASPPGRSVARRTTRYPDASSLP